jgi:hypothetical protein
MRSMATVMIVGCALAVTAACDGTSDESASRLSDAQEPMTLTGCLQRGGGSLRPGYILTMLNEPAGVGTSGSVTESGSSVEREQMRIAARTFRLSPTGDVELGGMVGKQVRVTGVIVDDADVPNGNGAIGSDSDSQRPNRDVAEQTRRGAQLDTSQLARLEVTSASIASEACGERREPPSGGTPGMETAAPGGVGPAR